MEVVDFIDYSENMIKTEKVLAQLQNLLLNRKFQEAAELGPVLITEARLLVHSINIANQNNEAYQLVIQQSQNIPAVST